MNLKQKFELAVSSNLESLNSDFENELKLVIEATRPAEAKFLIIEYDSQEFDTSLGVRVYALSKAEKLVGDVQPLSKESASVIPPEMYYPEEYDEEEFEEISPSFTASGIFESWLISRFRRVGTIKYPTYVMHHDSGYLVNIENGLEKNWNQIFNAEND